MKESYRDRLERHHSDAMYPPYKMVAMMYAAW
jgi:hypothetical protein